MENILNLHDCLFKETWSQGKCQDFLQYYLPHHLLAPSTWKASRSASKIIKADLGIFLRSAL